MVLHTNMSASTDSDHPRDNPGLRQLQTLKFTIAHAEFEGTDKKKNLLSLGGGTFLKYKYEFPQELIFLQTPEMKEMMLKHGEELQLDTTYGRIADNLKLTTILVTMHGFGVPVAVMMHEDEKKETYNQMWRFAKELGAMPAAKAIAGSVSDSVPGAQYRGDSWHLVNANFRNIKKLTNLKLEYKQLQPLLQDSLRSVMHASNQQELALSITLFCVFWRSKNRAYERYFSNVWVRDWPALFWAFCYLKEGTQHGNIHCEPWHNIVRQLAYSGAGYQHYLQSA